MTLLPEVDIAVELRDQGGGTYRTRVAEASEVDLLVDRPDDLPASFEPVPGLRLVLSWPDDDGLVCLPVELAEEIESNAGDFWLVEVAGRRWREQRREYVRSSLKGTVEIGYLAKTDAGAVLEFVAVGELIDVSEAGLRCAVSAEHEVLCVPETPVALDLRLDDEWFSMSGKVLTGKPNARGDALWEVVILFNRPVEAAERIRQHVRVGKKPKVRRPDRSAVKALRAQPPDGQVR